MSRRPDRTSLTAHLGTWSAEQIASLIQRRPDLVLPEPPVNVAELAQRAQQHHSVVASFDRINLAEDRLLQIIVCCQPDVPLTALAHALPEGLGLDDIELVLASLEALAMLWRHDGRVHSPGMLRQLMPTTLGPPLRTLIDAQTTEYLKAVVGNLRTLAAPDSRLAVALPERATGPNGRPPRKADLIDELESLLSVPEVVARILEAAPPEARSLATAMATGTPAVELPYGLYYSRHDSYRTVQPEYWLFTHAAVLPSSVHGGIAVQPREVGMALRGGRPVASLPLRRPTLATGSADPHGDRIAAERARRTLDVLADLLDRWSEQPATALKSGGLGVSTVRQTASALDVELYVAERLIELAYLAGLIETAVTTRKVKRQRVHDARVGTSSAANEWLKRPLSKRWRTLATAWLRADYWPSASGQQPGDAKNVPLLTPQWQAKDVEQRRREVLGVLAGLPAGEATTRARVVDVVYWDHPRPWLHSLGGVDATTAIGWVFDEAELLGLVGGGRLSSFGQAVLDGDKTVAELRLADAMPTAETTFTLQADLTAVVVGALDRDVLTELRLLADAESSGDAATYRFSGSSIRRAIDAGRDRDSILAFLETHSPKGVPQPLAYLVGDVARRHGHLMVGPAQSIVVSDDPAILADACSHRRTRKLGLRALAPTVAVSAAAPAKVIDVLRDAGFLPTADGNADTASVPWPAGDDVVVIDRVRGASASTRTSLPERFAGPKGGVDRRPGQISVDAAAKLAAEIIAGAPPPTTRFGDGGRHRSARPQPRLHLIDDGVNDDIDAEQYGPEDDEADDFLRMLELVSELVDDELDAPPPARRSRSRSTRRRRR